MLARVEETPPVVDGDRALERVARESFAFLWRCLRRLGVKPDDAVEDAVQRVFDIAVQKRSRIQAGQERAFLFKTAVLVAAEERRRFRRRREIADDVAIASAPDPTPAADELAEKRQWRQMLDAVLDRMPLELRTVFVLFEFEDMSTPDIAVLLSLPAGTVASRLRRAREAFHAEARRMRARTHSLQGGLLP